MTAGNRGGSGETKKIDYQITRERENNTEGGARDGERKSYCYGDEVKAKRDEWRTDTSAKATAYDEGGGEKRKADEQNAKASAMGRRDERPSVKRGW
jgi:hypothetical protein